MWVLLISLIQHLAETEQSRLGTQATSSKVGATMNRFLTLSSFVVLTLLFLVFADALAKNGPPPEHAEPAAQGISFVVLGGLDPVAAAGQGLEMREYIWEPESYVTAHTHPAAFSVCVQIGAVGFSIQSGAAIVT